ncbi:hypothetical protein NM208_g9963 [Fusarium decemcellulare]|uniref:Uncharacterized protein n=1 Tax=Fusarium decemcellulare TaxID=57161 RepID=A0ACC1RZT9_9HYPO|nr:hypothetical protein NM208_g9963 [Fusarium decemcellulare]
MNHSKDINPRADMEPEEVFWPRNWQDGEQETKERPVKASNLNSSQPMLEEDLPKTKPAPSHMSKGAKLPTLRIQRTPAEWRQISLECGLFALAAGSACAMERFARPETHPSATWFVAAIGMYASATGSLYFIHSENNDHLNIRLVFGGFLGVVIGLLANWNFEEMLFRGFPGTILACLLIGLHGLQ